MSGSSLYVGGGFTSYRGIANSAKHLAKLDLTNGSLDTTFSPSGNNGFNSYVNALIVAGSSLYVGGFFTDYRGIANSAKNIAKIDLGSGNLDTTFSPSGNNGFDSSVASLAVSGANIYVGGSFSSYRGVSNSAKYLAKLDFSGVLDTSFTQVNNGFNAQINTLIASGSNLYVGGYFTDYRGVANSSNRIAKLNLTSGNLDTTFSPSENNGFNNIVYSFLVSGTNIYIGGNFNFYRGTQRANFLVPIDTISGSLLD